MKHLNLHGHRTSVAMDPLLMRERDDDIRYACRDGCMTAGDVAKAAGVSWKAARRAVDAFVNEHEGRAGKDGVTLTFEDAEIPRPETATRAEMAEAVARRIGIGRFGLQQRIAKRAATRPPAKRKEKRVSTTQHPWTVGKHGRHVHSIPGGKVEAKLACSRCPASLSISFRQLCDAKDMDRKFVQKGWAVDPAKCPEHNRRNHLPRKDQSMTEATTFAAPTPAAIAAQAKMFGLLQTHFDPDTGTYGGGYSDAKIADETRLALDLVVGIRKSAFGELKVPSEVAQLNADIDALEQLFNENIAPIQTELAALRRRVAECCKKFGG